MYIRICIAKLHRVTVTQADLNYVGSVTIDQNLLDQSGIKPYQMVNINNLSNGVLWQTYVLAGEAGSGIICLNGPPARHFQPGDKAIVIAEAYVEPKELEGFKPVVVFVDDSNKVTKVDK
jgi:aspartate 1-decarboxylase